MSKPVKIRVIYKSGASVDFTCDDFKTTRNRISDELLSVEWVGKVTPEPISFGLNDVAAIWRLS